MEQSKLMQDNIAQNADLGILGKIKDEGKYGYKLFEMNVQNQVSAKKFNKEIGKYSTINISPSFHTSYIARRYLINKLSQVLNLYINNKAKNFYLIIGLGNAFLVADSLGPLTVKSIIATHNMPQYLKGGLADIACLIPGVSGINGINTFDVIQGIVKQVKPSQLIIIDTLATTNQYRIGCSFQISNTSITPGGAMGANNRKLDKNSLDADIISIGVPLMLKQETFGNSQLKNAILVPKEIDIYTKTCADCISTALNNVFYGKNYTKLL